MFGNINNPIIKVKPTKSGDDQWDYIILFNTQIVYLNSKEAHKLFNVLNNALFVQEKEEEQL
jgi:hypothetical protein